MTTKKPPKKGKILDKEPEQPQISPQAYFEMLKGITLEDLYLNECTALVEKGKVASRETLPYSWDDEVSYKMLSMSLLQAIHTFELIAPAGSKKDRALKISCTFVLTYSSKQNLTDEFLKIFSARNVPINTWPYFRELVQSMTQRMNIPPLVLPLLT